MKWLDSVGRSDRLKRSSVLLRLVLRLLFSGWMMAGAWLLLTDLAEVWRSGARLMAAAQVAGGIAAAAIGLIAGATAVGMLIYRAQVSWYDQDRGSRD